MASDSGEGDTVILPKTRLPQGVDIPKAYIWISKERLRELPTEGPAWENLQAAAAEPLMPPDLSDQNDPTNVHVLAKALVYARTGQESYRGTVINACMLAIGTQRGGRTLALGKELMAYVLAANLVGMPADKDKQFRTFLRDMLSREFPSGKTLRSTHEDRPNNWGTYAGATRAAIAAYLGDAAELARTARVFKGWLGDRDAYAGFTFKARDWQADPEHPVGINPAGATKQGHTIDGVLPDDQRRSGGFRWPPPKENYVYSALQGALAQAIILDRAGYDVWTWENQALRRAFDWLNETADYPARGDDTWQPHVINYYYVTEFPAPVPSNPGKNVGWTDWTHAGTEARHRGE
ncbi:hypothetical protein CKO21_03830 [Rhodovibrio salinarum]|uniref:Alginate lyase domain-containing protein n=2 Tax=Rhodovibrio salinarum TaxID=1087 RepID=A0A934UZG3_9PROT|nr:hypothetical protein [Rhodovibrio salinarum]